jgi:hypothetical protein
VSGGNRTIGIAFAFATGYVLGTRAGKEELDELKAAFLAVLGSTELADLTSVARSHASGALHELAGMVGGSTNGYAFDDDIVGRVKGFIVKE